MFMPFMLVAVLFPLWGFANDVTNPLVKAFREIFLISNAQSSLVQVAFYGGYATMAIPAALVIRKFSFKSGIVVGLMLYATGALLTIPASTAMNFSFGNCASVWAVSGVLFVNTISASAARSMIRSAGVRS